MSIANKNSEIKKIGINLISKLKFSGLIMIEFIKDSDNKYKIIEINPRLWGSILLSEKCNSNFIMNYIRLAFNKNLNNSKIGIDMKIRWLFPYEIFYFLTSMSNPIKFFKFDKNTCYINFSYSNKILSFFFIILCYPKKIFS